MTAKRWRTESAKAGHDGEERRDGEEMAGRVGEGGTRH